jgi:hypothetical protein
MHCVEVFWLVPAKAKLEQARREPMTMCLKSIKTYPVVSPILSIIHFNFKQIFFR